MYLTPENAKDYVGMKLYADRSIFHYYPLTVFQYPDLFNQVWFDRAEPYKAESEE